MSAAAQIPLDAAAGDRIARRNVLVLAFAQALAGANNTVITETAGIIGAASSAGDKSMATIPVSTFVIGMWVGTLPVGYIARRFGRLRRLRIRSCSSACWSGLTCCDGRHHRIICAAWCLGTMPFGGFVRGRAPVLSFRRRRYRERGVQAKGDFMGPWPAAWLAGVFGPSARHPHKRLILPQYLFAASYLAQAVVAVVAAGVLTLVKIPKLPPIPAGAGDARPLREIFRQPKLIAAVICGIAGYSMMNLIMTSGPLAMVNSHHSVTDAALGLQWHVVGMYAPSFFTGTLIARIGSGRVVAIGLATMALGAVIGMLGSDIAHFWTDLILLGVGWNFAYVGATAAVTDCHRPTNATRSRRSTTS